jgi:lipopolysaccharide export system permease protein
LLTLFVALCVFTFILLMGGAVRELSQLLVSHRLGLGAIGMFMLLLMPYLVGFALPMSLLASVLLVFGRLSADHEITAMRANGVSVGRVAAPVILLSVLLGAICFYVFAVLGPQCRFKARIFPLELSTDDPLALLQTGTYIRDFPGYVLYVGRMHGNTLEHVSVFVLDEKGNKVSSLRARRGLVTTNAKERKLRIDLQQVQAAIHDPADPNNLNKVRAGATAEKYPLELDLGPVYQKELAKRRIMELTFPELMREIRALRAKRIYPGAAILEAHHRVAVSVACVAFTLLGIPLGIKASRRETSIGMAIALGLAMLFHAAVVVADMLRDQPWYYPEIILWTPCLIFEVVGLTLLWRASRA